MDASCSSPSNKRKRLDIEKPSELPRQINYHIYELYTPKEEAKAVKLEIVFFHGLHFGSTSEEAYLTTWTNDDKVLWPQTWLPDEFPQARILSVSYDASMKQTARTGRQDLYTIAENLTHDIDDAGVGQSHESPIFLVGHCFGGLVIKELCVQASRSSHKNKKMGKFLDNLGGVFFYGTPHRGTDLFFDDNFLPKVLEGPLLEYVRSLNKHAASLDQDFLSVCHDRDPRPVRMASVGESNKTKMLGMRDAVIVPEGSARHKNYLYTLGADHISICKPISKTSNSFKLLWNFIRDIQPTKHVLSDPDNIQILPPKKSIGLDVKVEVIRERLEKTNIVGIVGMGGIGKTTLAMAAFNKFYQSFDYTCFVADVKLISGGIGGIETLEKKVFQLMCLNGKYISDMKTSDIEWKKKRLLLVLDDIGNTGDANFLSTMIHKAGPGSWFLVTCQKTDLLNEVEDILRYKMQTLVPMDAEKLFMSYAFASGAIIPQHLDALAKKMVDKCDGLPLTLKIIGKCLMGNEEERFWVQMYAALEEADSIDIGDYEKIWQKLKLSFDKLGHKEQQMFLDATTFFSISNSEDMDFFDRKNMLIFKGIDQSWHWKLSEAKAAWGVAYGKEEIRWQTLVNASLVYDVTNDEPIRVHEQLKSLGRRVAEDDKICKRVWNPWKGQELLLSKVPSDYQGIHSLRVPFSGSAFSSTPEDEAEIPKECCLSLMAVKYLERQYRHLGHNVGQPIGASECPTNFPADLIVLCSPTLLLSDGPIDSVDLQKPQMAVLILTDYSGRFLPKSLVRLSSLKIFHLWAEALHELPASFQNLAVLELLVIRCCRALKTLPASFGNLRALKELHFYHCDVFNSLSDDFGNLRVLEKLHLDGCQSLKSLPASFGNLRALKELIIVGCAVSGSLSDDFGKLPALGKLHIRSCSGLKTLPASFGNLRALKELTIDSCAVFGSLSDDFGNLPVLEELYIYNCDALSTLPVSFGNLRVLKELRIEYSYRLGSLSDDFGNLPALEKLYIRACKRLKTLPVSFGNLRALKELHIWYCVDFGSLSDDFGNLRALEKLHISWCESLKTLPVSFRNLRALRELTIERVGVFDNLSDDFRNLSALEKLHIGWDVRLKTLPASFGNLPALEKLYIMFCHALSTLPASFGNLRALKELRIYHCDVFNSLSDDFGKLPALEELHIQKCHALSTLPASFEILRALTKVIIKDCAVAPQL